MKPIDLATVDPATMKAGAKANAFVAEWMGWKERRSPLELNGPDQYAAMPSGQVVRSTNPDGGIGTFGKAAWSPSTNPAHAGEARRHGDKRYQMMGWLDEVLVVVDSYSGRCNYDETNGNKAEAEALATIRAIVVALKVKKEEL